MNKIGQRLLFGGVATVAVALGVGGIAYAAGDADPTPRQGYVTIEDGPGTAQESSGRQDCPDKGGAGEQGQDSSERQQESAEAQA